MAGIGPATSPLPRGCSTTEPHGHRHRFGHNNEPKAVTNADQNINYNNQPWSGKRESNPRI